MSPFIFPRLQSLLLVVSAIVIVSAPLQAAETTPELEAYLAAQRAAAAHAAQRDAQLVQPARAARARSPRAFGVPGAIAISSVALVAPADATAVPRFAKVELLVTIPTLIATNPFDPSPANGGIDLSAQFTGPGGVKTVKGYWDGADWRVRFAAHETGAWTYTVSATDSSGTASWSGGTFTCVPSANRGFLRVHAAALEYSADSRPFIGVGHNSGWQLQVEHPALSGETPATAANGTVPATPMLPEARSMMTNGENLLVFWLTTPWETPGGSFPQRAMIESTSTGIGVYNQAPCQYLDQLLTKAEAAGVRLLPAIWPHDCVRSSGSPWGAANWSANAYSTICAAAAFATMMDAGGADTPQWIAQRNFFRYLTARYGHSTALAGWIGVEGIDGMDAWVASNAVVMSWCSAVETWFAQNDVFRGDGTTFPLTFNGMGGTAHSLNVSSIRSINNWNGSTNLTVAGQLAQQMLQLAGKPRYLNELGAQSYAGATQPTHLHNGAWASIAAGATSTPMAWGDGQQYPRLTDGATGEAMQSHLRWLSQFVAQVPWAGYWAATSLAISDTGIAAWYTHVSDRGYGWVYRTDGGALGSRTLQVPVYAGRYTVWWFNPHADCTTPAASQTVTVTLGNTLPLATPTEVAGLPDAAWHYQQHPTVGADLTQDLTRDIQRTLTLDSSPSYNWMINAVITSLPADVRLYQTSDGVTRGAQILSVPAVVANAPLRVIAVSDIDSGARTFDFHLTEVNTASDPATMTLTLIPNQPPVANAATIAVVENTAYGVTLTGSDPEAQPLTFQVQTQPLHGVLSGTAPNLTYTPATNHHGDDNFTFTVHDGLQSSANATISISVTHDETKHVYPPHKKRCGSHGLATLVLVLGFGLMLTRMRMRRPT